MSLIINALAGTGKTFTLVGGIHHLKKLPFKDVTPSQEQSTIWNVLSRQPCPESVCFTAFTVSAKDEIKRRLPATVCRDVTTMHSMGLHAIKNQVGMSGQRVQVDKWKTDKLIEIVHKGMSITTIRKAKPGYPTAVKRLVQLCKYMIAQEPSDDSLTSLAGQYDVTLGVEANLIFDTVRKALVLAQKDCHRIDFDDMIWLPIILDMPIRKYDVLFIDEGQDLNRCQQQLALQAGREIVLAGDKHQAIYGFTGADTQSMTTMYNSLSSRTMNENTREMCKIFPLTVSRRCSHAVVREAQGIVPEFKAHKANIEGKVTIAPSYDSAVATDMILCRTNAPLLKEAFKMIAQGIPVEMLGRNIAENLINLIRTLKPTGIDNLQFKLDRYKETELKRLEKRKYQSEAARIAILDKCTCLLTFCQHNDSVEEVIKSIKNLFSNGKERAIKLSSIHQAKGLEARNTFIIRPDLLPHPLAKTPQQKEQEKNLLYVAITRAINTLTWVNKDEC